ncbi:MAG: DNA alkylation repair protein [Chlamydiales bacterium]|nr:DNA alkylation repair protein [Chlamydiales bacterium]
MSKLISELERAFAAAADPQSAKKQSAYLRNLFPFWGIPKPQRALIEKKIFAEIKMRDSEELERTLALLWQRDEREFQYTAIALGKRYKKFWSLKTLDLVEKMIREKSWWDTVDDLAANLVGPLVKAHLELALRMDAWIEDPYLWIRRTALIFQLRWKKETDTTRLFGYCKKTMHEKEFFMRKAIGWALREYSKTEPKQVSIFIKESSTLLSPLSIREGSKYLSC